MEYAVSFLEGMVTFISPCLLPMLPIYLVYFAGNGAGKKTGRTVLNSAGFVLGFTVVFVALGAFAATLGSLVSEHRTVVNIVAGAIVVVFGLNFTGVINIGFLNGTHRLENSVRPMGFFSAALFGMVFAVGWTPCVGAFLGSALLLASQQGSVIKGVLLLLAYSLGLGVPFILSALLIGRLEGAFDFIKKNYKVINIVCGVLLIAVGVLMMTGLLGGLLSSLSK